MKPTITPEQLARAKNGIEVQLASYQGLVAAGEILTVLQQASEALHAMDHQRAAAEAELKTLAAQGKTQATELAAAKVHGDQELAALKTRVTKALEAAQTAEYASAAAISTTARKTQEALASLDAAHAERIQALLREQEKAEAAGRRKIAAQEAELVALAERLVEMRQEAAAIEDRARAVLAHGGAA